MIFTLNEYSSQLNSCRLNTIFNVENFIRKNSGVYSKTTLWENLPKDVRYQSYKVVIDFLLYSNRIQIKDKLIFWNKKNSKFPLEIYTSQNHMPTLTSISNVLEFISQNSNIYSKTELWNNLPKKVMYQTYKVILEYLILLGLLKVESRKVIFVGGEIK